MKQTQYIWHKNEKKMDLMQTKQSPTPDKWNEKCAWKIGNKFNGASSKRVLIFYIACGIAFYFEKELISVFV